VFYSIQCNLTKKCNKRRIAAVEVLSGTVRALVFPHDRNCILKSILVNQTF